MKNSDETPGKILNLRNATKNGKDDKSTLGEDKDRERKGIDDKETSGKKRRQTE